MKESVIYRFINILSSFTLIIFTVFADRNVLAQQHAEPLLSNGRPPHAPVFELLPTTLIQKIDISSHTWNPSSSDPAGIAYWPDRGSLLIADSEIDEIPDYFTGDNIFESSLAGNLMGSCSTTNIYRSGWSQEPTGIAINPNNNHIFISDDEKGGKLFEIDLGADETYCTPDDRVTTSLAPGSGDAEGIAYGENKLFVAGGSEKKIFIIDLGSDGILGGGDDSELRSFDTGSLGFHDVEGVEYNPDRGTLFVVSTAKSDEYIGEVSLTGNLLNVYNLDYLGSTARSGLAYGPSSWNPDTKSIYLVSKGVDNFRDPDENDGVIWEIHLGQMPVIAEAPTLIGITRQDPNPTSAENVDFLVAFSKPVVGVSKDDFALLTTGDINSASIVELSGSDSTYTVTVSTGTGNGIIRLELVDTDDIKDRDGKTLEGLEMFNGNFEEAETYIVQKGLILVEPETLDFGNVVNRTWTETKTVTVRNVGAGPIKLEILTIGDNAPKQSMFLKFNSCNNAYLNPGAQCTFGVAFRPTGLGAVGGEVEFSNYLEGESFEIYLSGNGISWFTYLSNLLERLFSPETVEPQSLE